MILFKNSIIILLLIFTLSSASCKKDDAVSPQPETGNTIVNHFGQPRVNGTQLLDKNNDTISLHGMSLFWSQWGGDFYNESCIKWLRDDWKCTVVRAACAVESGGYLTNPQAELNKITRVIDAAIKLGIYVIVDWHDHNAEDHLEQAKVFFRTIAQKYGNQPNIIYEIYNEPLQVSWSNVIKPYAVEVIKTIREHDPDNLITVGTPNWSQDVEDAAADTINDVNIAYVLHFYTSTHRQWLRDKANQAFQASVPLFITEYGISEANGNGNIDLPETNRWFNFIKENKLSTCNWSVMDKEETSSALVPGASTTGNWTDNELSTSGKYIRDFLRAQNQKMFDALQNE